MCLLTHFLNSKYCLLCPYCTLLPLIRKEVSRLIKKPQYPVRKLHEMQLLLELSIIWLACKTQWQQHSLPTHYCTIAADEATVQHTIISNVLLIMMIPNWDLKAFYITAVLDLAGTLTWQGFNTASIFQVPIDVFHLNSCWCYSRHCAG